MACQHLFKIARQTLTCKDTGIAMGMVMGIGMYMAMIGRVGGVLLLMFCAELGPVARANDL